MLITQGIWAKSTFIVEVLTNPFKQHEVTDLSVLPNSWHFILRKVSTSKAMTNPVARLDTVKCLDL
jgi:hypothetical protein